MDIKTELLVRLIIALFFFIFLGKLFAPIIVQFLTERMTGAPKKKNVDLELLIANKEQMMRRGMKGPTSTADDKKDKSNPTEKAYIQASKETSDYIKILEFLDCIKWGEGKVYQELKSKFSTSLGVPVDLLTLSRAANFFVQKDILISLNKKELPKFDELTSGLKSKVTLDIIYHEVASSGPRPLFDRLAKKYKVSPNSLMKSFAFFISSFQKEDFSMSQIIQGGARKRILSIEKKEWDRINIQLILGKERQNLTSIATLMTSITEKAQLFEQLAPLPQINAKSDITKCYEILGITSNSSLEQVKKAYKKQAAAKHPDKFASQNLPSELEKILEENFSTIKAAYDRIQKKDETDG